MPRSSRSRTRTRTAWLPRLRIEPETLRWTLALLALSFLVRFLVLWLSGYTTPGGGDERYYYRSAREVLAGHHHPFGFMPGWSWLLAIPMLWTRDLFALRLFVMAIASTSSILVFLLAREVFGPRTARWAGLIFAFFPENILYSHYLYSEIALEWILLAGSWLAFRGGAREVRPLPCLAAGLVFGLGLLVKHFAGIPFVALLVTVARFARTRAALLVALPLVFATPLALHSFVSWRAGRDPTMFLNAAVKSAKEWTDAHPHASGFQDHAGRRRVLTEHLRLVASRPLGDSLLSIEKNLFNLWGPSTPAVRRLLRGKYPGLPWPRVAVAVSIGSFALLLLLGFSGLCLAESSPFRTYAATNLVLLSGLSVAWLVVSRYRVPFLFLLILYASRLLARPGEARRQLARAGTPRLAVLGLILLTGILVLVERLPHLRGHQ